MSSSSILKSNDSRYVMFPIEHQDIWEMYQKHVDCFWRPEEIDLSKDIEHWRQLTNEETYFLSMILAFFASSDGIVLENLAMRFMTEVQVAEARAFYGFQIAMENIHSHTYSLLIETLIKDSNEKHKLFNSIHHFPCIEKKASWAKAWMDQTTNDFATRLVGFACVEGIFFSGAFCSIYWIKKRGLMPGLTFSNELISRDEALHTEFAILLYKKMDTPLEESTIKHIISDAVDIEIEFINDALPCRLIGMNAVLMAEYIKFVADRLSLQLGYSKIYNVKNPFSFMELISLESKTNFFEKRVDAYALANMTKDSETFNLSDAF